MKPAYLFVDDAHIESLDNVSEQPLIEKDQPWEHEWSIGSYIMVAQARGRFAVGAD